MPLPLKGPIDERFRHRPGTPTAGTGFGDAARRRRQAAASRHQAPSPTGAGPVAALGEPGHTPKAPFTLAIDIGGTGLKASVLDATGAMVADRVVVKTTYPCPPSKMVDDLAALVAPLPPADRVSAGFPGMVRNGIVLSAPHFVTEHGPGTTIDAELVKEWAAFDLAGALATRLGKPTRVANDADVQGRGGGRRQRARARHHARHRRGDGVLLRRSAPAPPRVRPPSLPEGRHLQRAARRRAPARTSATQRWNKRVRKAVATLRALSFFDHCYIGGGNAKKIHGSLGADVSMVDNTAGILGGIRLWDESHIGV